MAMDDDDMKYFLHFLHEAFGELGDVMVINFNFLLCSFAHLLSNRRVSEILR